MKKKKESIVELKELLRTVFLNYYYLVDNQLSLIIGDRIKIKLLEKRSKVALQVYDAIYGKGN